MHGEPGGEMFHETVVGEEDQDDQDDEINNHPATPDNNKYLIFPLNIVCNTYIFGTCHNPIFFGNVIKTR